MKLLIFIIAAFVGLTNQLDFDFKYQYSSIFPLRATAILKGEVLDQETNVNYKIMGSVKFEQLEVLGNVTISVDIVGLPPHNVVEGVLRGLHIHTYGIRTASEKATAICGSSGSHYNPLNSTHGFLNSTIRRHFGDLGNIVTLKNGTVRAELVNDRLELFGPYSIIGRTVVLHEKEDDGGLKDTEMSRTVGSSGVRIACGVIGLDKSESTAVEHGYFSMIDIDATYEIEESDWEPVQRVFEFLSFEDPKYNGSEVNRTELVNSVDKLELKKVFSDLISNVLKSDDLKHNETVNPLEKLVKMRQRFVKLLQ